MHFVMMTTFSIFIMRVLCEAVKVDKSKVMNEPLNNPKTKETKYKETIAHTLSLVRVLFQDFGVAVTYTGKQKILTTPIPFHL